LKPGDVVVGVLVGAQETKVRPAVVIASATYLAERPDAVVGILTTKLPRSECRITLKIRCESTNDLCNPIRSTCP